MADDDARDELLGARLEVEPLDEVTRRRLVARALDEPPAVGAGGGRRGRVWRPLVASAAVVVVAVLGTLSLLSSSGDDAPTASRDADTASEAEAAAGTPSSAAQPPDTQSDARSSAAPAAGSSAALSTDAEANRSLADAGAYGGDFGDLTRPAALRALRSALSGPPSAWPGDAGTVDSALLAEAVACTRTWPSLTAPVVGFATGRLEGRPVVVLVVDAPDGTRAFHAVLRDPCEVRQLG